MLTSALYFMSGFVGLFAATPASTNFTLKSYDFGNGGATSSSSSYNLNGTVGTQTGNNEANGVTILKPGEKATQDANVPPAGILSNPSSSYSKLHLVISIGGNPTDTRFAIAVSNDGFATTKYVLADNSLGTTLTISNYQTYAQWGSGTGFDILGLAANTSYTVKVSAYQGAFSATAFGPVSAAVSTQPTTVSFSVATTSNGTPPFGVNFASLTPNTVFTADANALIGLTTNALFGGGVYIKDGNNGLRSTSKSYTIASATADLTSAASGYGSQVGTLGQTSGGPFAATAPFNGSANNVGQLSTTLQQILGLSAPITGGTAQIKFMAKTSNNVPPAADYADTQTIIAAMSF
ncbi:hypothetical protein H7Y63_01360 [Polaromonas sp.]|nr:hypothetical protein [Candidatus Saccharibacteria bacterium]